MPSNNAIPHHLIFGQSSGCSTFRPGHQVHWIQAQKALRDESRLPVDVHVEPELGLVQFAAQGEPRLFWHHRAARLVEIFQGQDGEGIWSPEFRALSVASNHGSLVFNLAGLEQVRPCTG
ncbi:hypothetical protein [Arthrobacter mobilis]|uniref:Uncharacterized protein n=1 Tax=Arthrobacter mobilis TaxID=2724944 RepID=A0A7X6HC45_9MICC|nr:hypothetical protein [Arthrobacter mobilis]NKX53012.1 hypothetical protein [Arthrobacter mobilis]